MGQHKWGRARISSRKSEPGSIYFYRALINLRSGHLESRGKQLRLVPGMRVNAEIHLGTRTVLEYLLSPVQEVAHEAGRER